MGGHASPGAGRLVDVAEGSHEVRLEGIDAPGEEGWCVQLLLSPLGVLDGRVTYSVAIAVTVHVFAAYPRYPSRTHSKAH